MLVASTSAATSTLRGSAAAAAAAATLSSSVASCSCMSSRTGASRRSFATSSPAAAKILKHKMAKEGDPFDMSKLQEFAFDDVPYTTHLLIEKDRARLHLLRLAAFQLPKLRESRSKQAMQAAPSSNKSNFIKVRTLFRPRPDGQHPAERKAVLTVRVDDLIKHSTHEKLQPEAAQHKLKLLAGPRYDPDAGTIKISCDMFPTQLMNSKWCSDALDRLVAEAEDLTDPMTDIALNLRHAEVRKLKKGKRRASLADVPSEWLPESMRVQLKKQ